MAITHKKTSNMVLGRNELPWCLVMGHQQHKHSIQLANMTHCQKQMSKILIQAVLDAQNNDMWIMWSLTCAMAFNWMTSAESKVYLENYVNGFLNRKYIDFIVDLHQAIEYRHSLPDNYQDAYWRLEIVWLLDCYKAGNFLRSDRIRMKAAKTIQARFRGWTFRRKDRAARAIQAKYSRHKS